MKKHLLRSSRFNLVKPIFFTIIILSVSAYVIFLAYSSLRSAGNDINYSGLEIISNNDTSVYIDNQLIGTSSPDKTLLYTKVEPGNHRVKMVKNDDELIKYERDMVFEKGTQVSIDWNFGVTNETSSGIVKYFVKKKENTNKIRIISLTSGVTLSIDGSVNKDGFIDADGNEHVIDVSKDGYLSKSLTLSLVNNVVTDGQNKTSTQSKYSDYDLVVEITLFQIPFM